MTIVCVQWYVCSKSILTFKDSNVTDITQGLNLKVYVCVCERLFVTSLMCAIIIFLVTNTRLQTWMIIGITLYIVYVHANVSLCVYGRSEIRGLCVGT